MTLLAWICVLLGLYGTWLNAEQNRNGFIFWIVANIGLSIVNIYNGMYPQAVLFYIYTIFAVRGLFLWKD
jgi:hypothetical protein